jgi:hypothetical protein
VPDKAYEHFEPLDTDRVEAILDAFDYDPKRMLGILEAVQAELGWLPVAALKQISFRTGAYYALIYGTASYYRHLRLDPPDDPAQARAAETARPSEGTYLAGLGAALDGRGAAAGQATGGPVH